MRFPLWRFVAWLLLVLVLVVGCQASPSSDLVTGGEEHITGTLTTRTVPTEFPYLWWEAETPAATNFPPASNNPFAPEDAAQAQALSNGAWIGVEGPRSATLFAEYTVTVPQAGDYFFYSRKFWQHGPFRWRWDDQPWQTVTKQVYLMDATPLRKFVVANWVTLGRVSLTGGEHRLRIELTENDGAAAFDCFLLSQEPFQPRGTLRPNQRYQADIPNWFVFDPEADGFRDSAIDLRSLNEPIAGGQGRIQTQGEALVLGNGQPVKFWAVNMGMDTIAMDATSQAYLAQYLAKRGVNLVRLHGRIWQEDNFRTIDPQQVERLANLVQAFKQEGIYTALSIYFPLWVRLDETSGFAGYDEQHPFALLFFNEDFQQIYQSWWRSLLDTPHPKTGQRLRDEPAIAMVELLNEDSYFFWTFNYDNVPAPQMAQLERQFGTWLMQKYGSLDEALATWARTDSPDPPEQHPDRPQDGRISFLPLYQLSDQRTTQRAQDTVRFLAASQQQFFEQSIRFLRQDLRYPGLVVASNWITANPQILGPVDKYTNTVADVMDRHGYFAGPHEGDRASFSLNAGNTYRDRSALFFTDAKAPDQPDFSLPIADLRYNNLPSTISEVNWPQPNRFRAEFPLLAAAYGALQGTDSFMFFATSHHSWEPSLSKFAIATPTILGQFPAAALAYRNGLIAPGPDVATVTLSEPDLFALKGLPVTAPQNLDALREQDVPPGQAAAVPTLDSIDPLAFYVGRVTVQFTPTAQPSEVTNLSRFIDREAKVVQSATEELTWNYDQGLMTVNVPQVQAVTGFLKQAGTVTLADLVVQSELEYGTVMLVALDGQPLARSRRMLLQVMSEERNFGWWTTGSPEKTIKSVGMAPIVVRELQGQIQLPQAQNFKVKALDANGYVTSTLGSARQFALQPATLYYLIEP